MNSGVPSKMNELNNLNDGSAGGFTPSDQELFDYLLGSLSNQQVQQIENWLASDVDASERVADLSGLLLDLNQAMQVTATCSTSPVVSINKASRSLRYQRLAAGLAVAAAVGFIAFSLAGFWRETTETQVAMAWVDALPSVPGADFGSTPSVPSDLDEDTGAAFGSETMTEVAFLDEEEELTSDMDFMSDEPPDWLLAAVYEMHGDDATDDSLEVLP
jgi:hypothetical protein